MIAHHDGVFKEEEIGRAPVLLNFSEWPWGCRGRADRDELGKLEFIFIGEILRLSLAMDDNALLPIQESGC